MNDPVQTGCFVLDEIRETANVKGLPGSRQSEAVRPVILAERAEHWHSASAEREFKILLHDRRLVTVMGRDLRYISSEGGTYAVVTRSGGEELTLALFPAKEVEGIFSGDIQLAPSI